jgi:hypothetical protein
MASKDDYEALLHLRDTIRERDRLRALLSRAFPRLQMLLRHADETSPEPVDTEHHWQGTRALLAELEAELKMNPEAL